MPNVAGLANTGAAFHVIYDAVFLLTLAYIFDTPRVQAPLDQRFKPATWVHL